jgi:hypothetical protein
MWQIDLSALDYNLRLLAWGIGLVAGMRIIFATAGYGIRRWVTQNDGSRLGKELWLHSHVVNGMASFPPIRRWLRRWVPRTGTFFIGLFIGLMQPYLATKEYHDLVLDGFVNGDHSRWVLRKLNPKHGEPPTGEYSFKDRDAAIGMNAEPGVIIETIRFRWDHNLVDIERSDLGVWFKRNPVTHLALKETSYVRRSQ